MTTERYPATITYSGEVYELEHLYDTTKRPTDLGSFVIYQGEDVIAEFALFRRLIEGGEMSRDLPSSAEITVAAYSALDNEEEKDWAAFVAPVFADMDAETIGARGPQSPRPAVTTICGSMRYFSLMLRVATEETAAGRIVLMPYEAVPQGEQNSAHKEMLDELHRHKIRASSRVIVVSDETGYYGTSTKGEITYAESLGLPVEFRKVEAPDQKAAYQAAWEAFRAAYFEYQDRNRAWRSFWTDHHAYAFNAGLAALKEGQQP